MPLKILFLVPYAPNLIRVRPYNLIRHLAEAGNEITLLTLWSDQDERASLRQVEPYVQRTIAVNLSRWRSLWNCILALPTHKPLQSVYCWQPLLVRQLSQLPAPGRGRWTFDVAHVEHLRGAQYGLYIQARLQRDRVRTPIVWDSVDSISLLFRQAAVRSASPFSRALTRFELRRTEDYEGRLVKHFDQVTVTSPADRDALLELAGPGDRADISVLPNGVDLDYFKPDPGLGRDPHTIVVSGKMSYHANITMVMRLIHEIMPLVWARIPEAQLLVVGKDPSREIQALAHHPNITVTGTVPDLPPFLQRATLAVAPIAYGAGIQNKVLEAMACATPVVASTQAVAALQARPGVDLLTAQKGEEFAAQVVALLQDPDRRRKLGQAGRVYVEIFHDWRKIAAQLQDLYTSAIRDKASLQASMNQALSIG